MEHIIQQKKPPGERFFTFLAYFCGTDIRGDKTGDLLQIFPQTANPPSGPPTVHDGSLLPVAVFRGNWCTGLAVRPRENHPWSSRKKDPPPRKGTHRHSKLHTAPRPERQQQRGSGEWHTLATIIALHGARAHYTKATTTTVILWSGL